jgi:hypothetical protein
MGNPGGDGNSRIQGCLDAEEASKGAGQVGSPVSKKISTDGRQALTTLIVGCSVE